MLKSHGTFAAYEDARRSGSTFKNENDLDWQRFVMRKVLFNDFGIVLEVYDDKDQPIVGDCFFGAVKDGVVVACANRDPSSLFAAFPAEVVETDTPLSLGMLYTGKAFKAAPPPPVVVHKGDFFASFTDEQHATWAEGYAEATPKQKNIWENTISFLEGTDEYLTAQSLAVAIFGPYGYNFFPK